MDDTTNTGWSTPRFLLTLCVLDFVSIFLLNGLLNEVLHLGIPSWLIVVPPTVLFIMLLPRWGWFRQKMQRRAQSK